MVIVAGHIPRFRQRHRVNRGSHLNPLAERDEALRRAHLNRLNDVGAGLIRRRRRRHAKDFKHARRQTRRLNRLRNGMRRHKQSLIEWLVACGIRTNLQTDARRGQAVGDALDGILRADDVAARGGKSAARILDEAANAHVRAVVTRFLLAYELAVAVVHHQANAGVLLVQHLRQGRKLLRHQRRSPVIAAAALGDDELRLRGDGVFHRVKVDFAATQRHGMEAHTHFPQ